MLFALKWFPNIAKHLCQCLCAGQSVGRASCSSVARPTLAAANVHNPLGPPRGQAVHCATPAVVHQQLAGVQQDAQTEEVQDKVGRCSFDCSQGGNGDKSNIEGWAI